MRIGGKTWKEQRMKVQSKKAESTVCTLQCEKQQAQRQRSRRIHPSGDKQALSVPSHVASAVHVPASQHRCGLHSTRRLTTHAHTRHHGIATMGALLSIPMLALPSIGTVSTARSPSSSHR